MEQTSQSFELLLFWNIGLSIGLLVAGHFIWKCLIFIRGNGKEKKPNGLWMLDLHDYRNLQQVDAAELVRIKKIEKFLKRKYTDWGMPFAEVDD